MNKFFIILGFLGILPINAHINIKTVELNHVEQNNTMVPLIPRNVLFGNPSKASPKVSPDGKQLAYLAPHNGVLNVWVKTIGSDDDHLITTDTHRGIRQYLWAYETQDILFLQDVNGNEDDHLFKVNLKTNQITELTPFPGVKVFVCSYRYFMPNNILLCMNKEDARFFDVYNVNLQTGTLDLAAKNDGSIDDWIADDNLQIRAAMKNNPNGSSTLLFRQTIQDDWQTLLTWQFEDHGACLSFSQDGTKLYLIDSTNVNANGFVEFDIATQEKKVLFQDPTYDVSSILFSLDHRPLALSVTKEREHWVALDEAFREHLEALQKIDTGDLFFAKPSGENGRFLVVGFVHDNQPTSYYLYDCATKQAQFLFVTKPGLSNYQLAPMKPISFTSRDELTIHGYLTTPLNIEAKNLPLVLYVHGGPWARDKWGNDPMIQLLANRGYACLQVNFRGSTGYGQEFKNLGNKEWGNKMHNDLVDAVAWAIDCGLADPQKIAILGGSYGGYAALAGAAFTPDLFCCAIDIVGPSNIITLINSFPSYWEASKKIMHLRIGDPETETEFLIERSPLFKAHDIIIPLLIAHGANDPRVKQAESEQIVAAIKNNGGKYLYMLFADEGHGFAKPENNMAFRAVAEEFLAQYLGGRYEPNQEVLGQNITLQKSI
jgi:dipeptidyl aminopeptidase/acylaminoacyl peptidase